MLNQNDAEVNGPYFEPFRLKDDISAVVMALALGASAGHVVICTGAGLSKQRDTNLPLGGELATLLYRRLIAMGQDRLVGGCAADDLLCIADTAEAQMGGMDLIQSLLPTLASFDGAEPNFSHEVIALLILEGAVKGITFNWDDCIERANVAPPRIEAVISDADRLAIREPMILKTHGSITRDRSLLVSSKQLADPPTWVTNELGARLSESKIVFVGVGDVPRYVQVRIQQLYKEIADPGNVYVVAPVISGIWESLLPGLMPARKLTMSANRLLSELINAYVKIALAKVVAWASDGALQQRYGQVDIGKGASDIVTAFEQFDGATILKWLRSCAQTWPTVRKIMHSAEAHQCLCSASVIAGRKPLAGVDADRMLITYTLKDGKKGSLDFILASGQSSKLVEDAARTRIRMGLRTGRIRIGEDVLVVCHGHVGTMASARSSGSIFEADDPADLISGPEADWLRIVTAQAVMDGDLPGDWK